MFGKSLTEVVAMLELLVEVLEEYGLSLKTSRKQKYFQLKLHQMDIATVTQILV